MSEECLEAEDCDEGLPAWVMTFADLMSLLMCFFVLLLSFSQMDLEKFKQVAGSVKMAFGVQRDVPAIEPPKGTSIIAQEYSPGEPKPTVIKVIKQETIDVVQQDISSIDPATEQVAETVTRLIQKLEDEIEKGLLQVVIEDERLLIRINERGSFGSGLAKLSPSFRPVLTKIADVLNSSPGKIIVAGHTDNIPITTKQYPSNWVLSSARAASVVHHIAHHGLADQSRIQIRAHADSKPLAANDSPANRAKNRRIEINIDTASENASAIIEERKTLEN